MFVRTTACVGMVFLLCGASPVQSGGNAQTAPPPQPAAEAPASAWHGRTVPTVYGPPQAILAATQPGAVEPPPARPQATTPPAAKTRSATHRRFHRIRHHVRAPATFPIGEIRSQIAETVGLLNQMDENVRNQLTETRGDTARLLAGADGQAAQVSLIDRRVDGIDERQATEIRARRQDTAMLQSQSAQQGARIDGIEQRIAAMAGAHANAPLYVAGGLAGLGVLLGIIALFVSYRQRLVAVAQAESHADRLYRTYRAEFEGLAQIARDLEARLQKTALPSPAPALRLYPEPEAVRARN